MSCRPLTQAAGSTPVDLRRPMITGEVGPEQVPRQRAAPDKLVGLSCHEGLGLAFAEAFRAGTTVIATAVGGIVDLTRREETGLLVPVSTPKEIAVAVERLVSNPALAARPIAAGAALVDKKITRSAIARAFSDLYCSPLSAEGTCA